MPKAKRTLVQKLVSFLKGKKGRKTRELQHHLETYAQFQSAVSKPAPSKPAPKRVSPKPQPAPKRVSPKPQAARQAAGREKLLRQVEANIARKQARKTVFNRAAARGREERTMANVMRDWRN